MRTKASLLVLAATAGALVLTGAASAGHYHVPGVSLRVLPLPKAQLGAAASSLDIEQHSGDVSNSTAASRAFSSVTAYRFEKLGRIDGYALDYGVGQSGGPGVTEIWTSVDGYKTPADAKKGLAFWQSDDQRVARLNAGGFAVTDEAVTVPAVGAARFAFLSSFSAPNITPLYSVDEQFTEGRYAAEVTIWAGTAADATTLASTLANKLDARIKHALARKLHAKPVKVPGPQQPGPPPGGPDLTQAVLTPSDWSDDAGIFTQDYVVDRPAVSDYSVFFLSSGPFGVNQAIEWFVTPNAANFWADWRTASTFAAGGTAFDLSGVGHGAQGAVIRDPKGDVGEVALTSGHATEFLYLDGNAGTPTIQVSDVRSIAQSAATKLASVAGG